MVEEGGDGWKGGYGVVGRAQLGGGAAVGWAEIHLTPRHQRK